LLATWEKKVKKIVGKIHFRFDHGAREKSCSKCRPSWKRPCTAKDDSDSEEEEEDVDALLDGLERADRSSVCTFESI
jgi:hypothetical protein